MNGTGQRIVATAASNYMAVLERNGFDPTQAREDVMAALKPMVDVHKELYESAFVRPTTMAKSRLLYFDPELLFLISEIGPEFTGPAHNHWYWNVLLICSGRMRFRWYRRLDDRSEPGVAKLELADERILCAGDVGMVAPPPHDVHSFEVLDEHTWLITVAPCPEPDVREFYDVDRGTYVNCTFDEARARTA